MGPENISLIFSTLLFDKEKIDLDRKKDPYASGYWLGIPKDKTSTDIVSETFKNDLVTKIFEFNLGSRRFITELFTYLSASSK